MKTRTRRIGNFGNLVKNYVRARTEYPLEVFDYLRKLKKGKKLLALDLGCGTGISTRQLARLFETVGCDKDPIMLRYARKSRNPGVKNYVRASADRLPFTNETFDIVSAFSAFHWFDDRRSVMEIKRILKPGGLLFVANKTGVVRWGEGYRKAIIKSTGRHIAAFKENSYNPVKTLRWYGFRNVKMKHWNRSEFYTLQKALQYVQSVSIWNSVPGALRLRALDGVRSYFKKVRADTGKIERKMNIRAVSGAK